MPGDRGNMGGIIGIDPSSWDRSVASERQEESHNSAGHEKAGESTKIRIMKREDVDAGGGGGGGGGGN